MSPPVKAQLAGWTLWATLVGGILLAFIGNTILNNSSEARTRNALGSQLNTLNVTMERMIVKLENHIETHKSPFTAAWKNRIRVLEKDVTKIKSAIIYNSPSAEGDNLINFND